MGKSLNESGTIACVFFWNARRTTTVSFRRTDANISRSMACTPTAPATAMVTLRLAESSANLSVRCSGGKLSRREIASTVDGEATASLLAAGMHQVWADTSKL